MALSPQQDSTGSTLPLAPWHRFSWQLLLAGLTLLAFLIQGYHPLAEDGGLYVAGIEWKLNPSLFPHDAAFVTEHLRFSMFAPTIATLTRLTHLPLAWTLLLVDLFALWLTMLAAWQILRRCLASEAAQLAGVALFAAWSTLPVAGTALTITDPYLTARSLSTPLSMLAIAYTLDGTRNTRSLGLCGLCLTLAALFHPLMTVYALGVILPLHLLRLRRVGIALALLTFTAIGIASTVQFVAPPESPALILAEFSRTYWFLARWQWFELAGLLAPLAVLALLQSRRRHQPSSNLITLCRAAMVAGLLAILISLAFAREPYATHLVARMQPLRIFLLIYALMVLLLGGVLTEICLRRSLLAMPPLAILAAACVMFFVQRGTFPASRHLELPWRVSTNPNQWVQAFLWARANTPPDALFAIDPNYITTSGEDAHTFRAIAQRSVLPDDSKDAGEASITPALAEAWIKGDKAQQHLSELSDPVRDSRLKPFGVTWIVLHSSAITGAPCPYDNGTVKVCRVLR